MQYQKVCPICGSENIKVLKKHLFELDALTKQPTLTHQVSDHQERLWIYFHKILNQKTPSTVESTICQQCDFIFSNPRMSETDVTLKYKEIDKLGFDKKRHLHTGTPKSTSIRGNRVFQLISGLLKKETSNKSLNVLDYGGAEGYILEPFLKKGHRAFLLDYLEYHLTHPDINYLGRDLEDLTPDAPKFDVILLLHTLEHAAQPVSLIKNLAQHLTDEGLLYIEVPLGAWLEWEFLKEPVTHLNFFSESSLLNAANIAGLNCLFINSQWQWVTTNKYPCINMVVTKGKVEYPPNPKTVQSQMNGLSYFLGGFSHNPKYYTKLVLFHYLNKMGINVSSK